jgi:transcription antitermination factor NusG
VKEEEGEVRVIASALNSTLRAELPAEYLDPHWYAAYTCARHEKRVGEQLGRKGLEFFLPLYRSRRRWKDRTVELALPLFPSYVFVRIPLQLRFKVLEVPSVVRLVGLEGHPTPLLDRDIEILRNGFAERLKAEPHPYLTVGRKVRICSGPLQGATGILVRHKERFRVVLSIDLIMRSLSVEVDAADVEPLF